MVHLVLFSLLLCGIESHLYKCPDIYQTACTPNKCSSKDADKRALHLCDVWPYWSGGWGIFDEKQESYSCMNSTNSYCSVWSTQQSEFITNSTETCFCIDNNINNNIASTNYCSFWICTEYEIFTNWNCTAIAKESEICEDLLDKEYNECHCLNASINDEYCMKWQCLQFLNDEIQETANYLCHSDDSDELKEENITNINYCEYWSGDIEAEWKFEILDCHCDIFDNSSNFCIKWKCDEKEMIKHYSSGDKHGHFHAVFWPLVISCFLGACMGSATTPRKLPTDPVCCNMECWMEIPQGPATYTVVCIVIIIACIPGGGIGFLTIWIIVLAIPVLWLKIYNIVYSKIKEIKFKRLLTKNEQNQPIRESTSASIEMANI